MFTVLVSNWISSAFYRGPLLFLVNFRFYTVWNETFVTAYFFLLAFFHPLTRRHSDLLVSFQHQVVVSQTIVVVVFWTILAPNLGLEVGGGSLMIYVNIYKHTFPFLCILHEFLVTYGLYKNKGIIICLITFIAYAILNLILALGFNIIVYPTKTTDPHNWQAYPTMAINLLIIAGVGKLAEKLKRKIILRHYFKVNGNMSLTDSAKTEGPIHYN